MKTSQTKKSRRRSALAGVVFIDDSGTITSHSGRLGLDDLTDAVEQLRTP